jgi:hypothetical protein
MDNPVLFAMMVMAVITTMAFIAYNHPRQYFGFMVVYALLLVIVKLFALGIGSGEEEAIAAIKASELAAAPKTVAIEAIKNYETPTPKWLDSEFVANALAGFHYYALALCCLPLIDLTAQNRGGTATT